MLPDIQKITISDEAQLLVAVLGIITAYLGIVSYRKSIKERHLDLRWRQANSAKDFIHEMHSNKHSADAIDILDWFITIKFENKPISYEKVIKTLPKIISSHKNETDIVEDIFTSEDYEILKSFDWFFYYIDRTEQHIKDDFFTFDNVKYVFYPYYKKICNDREIFNLFAKERCYFLANQFWKRYDYDDTFLMLK